ncbi:hypothetical protein PH210_25770 [Paenibacillus sp. BSR1-1]|uniref:hypothetical protein n=1 Tax=Paenibacillus sp. BSR1-1 TaxID=3020845 RepID=UPI0025B16766|nr:hypothetical protein [Paenibacillus sp. BSR1-1]MDN3019577.1 hypothetical protein [Paenibacillus sp. BSR1-1]
MSLHTFAWVLPLVFLLYQIVIDFLDLYPFNDIHSRDKRLRKFEVLGNYPPLIIISACFFFDNVIANWVGYTLTSIIMIMHLFAWWLPYLFGFPLTVKADYEKYFSRTYKILPSIKDHIIPDVEHIGVGVLLLTTLFIQSWYLF